MLTTVAKIVSFSLTFLYLVPIVSYIVTKDSEFLIIFIASLFVNVLVTMAKVYSTQSFPKCMMLKRPKGAFNCHLDGTGGNMAYLAGFPSGHVTQATFISWMLAWKLLPSQWYFVACLYVIAMMVSRIIVKCHNVPQVLAGVLFGGVCAILTILGLKRIQGLESYIKE